jgi:hypothetical protein
MNQSELQRLQKECHHQFSKWEFQYNVRNERDCYTRVCPLCMKVDTHVCRVAPDVIPLPRKAAIMSPEINAAVEERFKDKITFVIKVATSIVMQKPGVQVCYIAGKVTGLPEREVRNKFARKKAELLGQGFIVLNPCDFIPFTCNWKIDMRMASTLLMMSDCICMLPCWQESEGAKVEFELAAKFGISIISE